MTTAVLQSQVPQPAIKIRRGHLKDRRVLSMLDDHLACALKGTGPGSAHALKPHELDAPEITFWSAWDGDDLLGMVALKVLNERHGEVKSLHVADHARGRGVGNKIMRHVVAAAMCCGMARLSLETGTWDYYGPARALYRRLGFEPCTPFADYAADPNSCFMTMNLE